MYGRTLVGSFFILPRAPPARQEPHPSNRGDTTRWDGVFYADVAKLVYALDLGSGGHQLLTAVARVGSTPTVRTMDSLTPLY